MSDQNNCESQPLIDAHSNYGNGQRQLGPKPKALCNIPVLLGAGFLAVTCGLSIGFAFRKHGDIAKEPSSTIQTSSMNHSIPQNIHECVADYTPLTIDEIRLIAVDVASIPTNTTNSLSKTEYDWLLQLALEGDTVHRKHVRKEVRTLTEEEWMRYSRAVSAMTQNYPSNDSRSEYDIFVTAHAPGISPTAHFGPTFLLWHRVYLDKFEAALTRHEPDVSIPYWDTVVDDYLPSPEDSVVWTESLFGPNTGQLTTGVFAGHTTLDGYCSDLFGEIPFRNLTSARKTRITTLLNNAMIEESVLNRTTFNELMQPADVNWTQDAGSLIEMRHDGVHAFVGGNMLNIPCSPTDPMFWIWHAFVDELFEEFRTKSQLTDRQSDYFYTPDIDLSYRPNAPMEPFGKVPNIWGLSDHFTKQRYSYAKRPSKLTCKDDSECGSSLGHFWCNECGQCVSKVKIDGDCTGLPNKACFCSGEGHGKCLWDRCQCAP